MTLYNVASAVSCPNKQTFWYDFFRSFSFNRYALYVNDSLLFTDILDFVASPLILNQPFYMGGIPLNESSQVPYALCFTGGMKDLIIDSR